MADSRRMSPGASEREWVVGLSSWVIEDGNYAEFHRGQQTEFALEFHPAQPLIAVPVAAPNARRLEDDRYRVTARLSLPMPDVWVIDCGVLAYHERDAPQGVPDGATMAGVVALGVDPFLYFERLGRRRGMPPLIYAWEILQIRVQEAAVVAASGRGSTAPGWHAVDRTHTADGALTEFLLTCRLLDAPPRRSRALSRSA
jgi:hypothetical protein